MTPKPTPPAGWIVAAFVLGVLSGIAIQVGFTKQACITHWDNTVGTFFQKCEGKEHLWWTKDINDRLIELEQR